MLDVQTGQTLHIDINRTLVLSTTQTRSNVFTHRPVIVVNCGRVVATIVVCVIMKKYWSLAGREHLSFHIHGCSLVSKEFKISSVSVREHEPCSAAVHWACSHQHISSQQHSPLPSLISPFTQGERVECGLSG